MMGFTTNHLSASNLSHIFSAVSFNAEAGDDYCIVRNEIISSVCIDREQNTLQFVSHISVFNLNDKEISQLVSNLNNEIDLLKITYDSFTNPDGSRDISFFYGHVIFSDASISPINIIKLHSMFERLVYDASYLCREASLSKNLDRQRIDIS